MTEILEQKQHITAKRSETQRDYKSCRAYIEASRQVRFGQRNRKVDRLAPGPINLAKNK
jgi:hypothetical protein